MSEPKPVVIPCACRDESCFICYGECNGLADLLVSFHPDDDNIPMCRTCGEWWESENSHVVACELYDDPPRPRRDP
jgi:hypothetical protein